MATIDELTKTKFTDDRHRLVTNIMYTSNWIKNLFTELLKPYGLSVQQFNILRILRGAKDWVAMNDVKRLMIEKAPNATRLSDKLLEKKLIERKRSEQDRRMVYLRISDAGLAVLEQLDLIKEGEHIDFIGRITEEEAKALNLVIDKLRG
ncbi:MarR family winged helix-turn-helix transcriptional regulator [Aureispira anguillae]|uniref:MarR family transcriptional regulator n=1 Tax=Aureispira anguillae TaxID=2864201 RepID=A0A915YEI3_9BACT|nr:MarR family transcriptional regulator [Aureispira anguillae]BDS11538.1 MarR family transcriptional regulator [Aureispira anguillae]